jgi:hypothetical protein
MRVPKRKLLGYLPHLFDAVIDIKQQRRRMIDPPPPINPKVNPTRAPQSTANREWSRSMAFS